jgi:hypothetical protein
MALTDGLLVRVLPQDYDTEITDIQSAGTLTGSGTKTLVDVSGEKAWNLTAANYTIAFTPQTVERLTEGTGITFAIRYRLNSYGTNSYNKFFGILTDAALEIFNITKNNASNGLRTQWNTTTQVGAISGGTVDTHTLVCVISPNDAGGSNERIHTWVKQVSRTGTDADYLSAVGFTDNSNRTVDKVYFNTPNSMDYDLLDIAVWDRQLTDAEAAAVADDLRTQLPLGGGSDTTPDAFSFTDQTDVALSTLTTSNTITVTGIDAATAISVTGGEMSINSGAFGSASTTVVASDTVQLRVTSSASNSTAVAVTLDIGGVTDEWSVTTLAVVSGGTITTGAFKNNTGTPQTGLTGLRVVVLDPTDGTTVLNSTGNTTHATTAVMTVSDAALTASETYAVITLNSAGTAIGAELITAT